MKHFYLWMIIPLLFSCTAEDKDADKKGVQAQFKTMNDYPENRANAFDTAGKLHNDLCLAYENAPVAISSLDDAISIMSALCAANIQYGQLTSGSFPTLSSSRLTFILQTGDNAWQVIEESSLSPKGKVSLTNFLSTVEMYKTQGTAYDVIYQFIVDYENSVLQDSSFSSLDRQIIFTTSSIARYANYFASVHKKKPPRDKDWDANIGNIVAGTDGSQQSMTKAVSMSVAASLYNNR